MRFRNHLLGWQLLCFLNDVSNSPPSTQECHVCVSFIECTQVTWCLTLVPYHEHVCAYIQLKELFLLQKGICSVWGCITLPHKLCRQTHLWVPSKWLNQDGENEVVASFQRRNFNPLCKHLSKAYFDRTWKGDTEWDLAMPLALPHFSLNTQILPMGTHSPRESVESCSLSSWRLMRQS